MLRPSEKSGWEGWIPRLSASLFLLVLLLRAGEDADTWFHLAAGRWIWTHGTVPWADPFALAAAHPYLDSHWLFQIVLAALHRLGGIPLLVLVQAGIFLAAFRVLETSLDAERRSLLWPLLLSAAAVSVAQRFLLRPDMATFLFLALYWRLLFDSRPLTQRRIALVCLCQALWVNMHGLFALGLAAVACRVLGDGLSGGLGLRREIPASRGKLAALSVGSLAACFATPYGAGLLGYAFKIFGEIGASADPFMRALTELRSPFAAYRLEPDILVFYGIGAAVAASAALNARKLRIGPTLWIAALAYLSWSARRNAAYFVFIAAPYAIQNIPAWKEQRRFPRKTTAAILTALLLAGSWFVASGRYYAQFGRLARFGISRNPYLDPSGALAFAERANLKGQFFNDYAFGGPIMHRWSPARKVFVDGRWEVYGMPFLKRYTQVTRTPETLWDEYAREYGIEFAILHSLTPASSGLIGFLSRSPDWRLTYADSVASVFVRTAGVNAAALTGLPAFRLPLPPPDAQRPSAWKRFWNAPHPFDELAMGRFAYFAGNPAVARAWFLHALKRDPRSPDAHFNLGTLEFQARDWDAAQSRYRRALALDPKSAAARSALAAVHLVRGRHAKALELLRQSVRLDPGEADVWKLLATALVRSGDDAGAAAALEKAVALRPRDASLRRDLAVVALRLGREDEAREQRSKARELDPAEGDAAEDPRTLEKTLP